jgi:hypothetical protein
VTTVTVVPTWSAGVSIFVALTTTGSSDFTSCARATPRAASTITMTISVRAILHSFSAKGVGSDVPDEVS